MFRVAFLLPLIAFLISCDNPSASNEPKSTVTAVAPSDNVQPDTLLDKQADKPPGKFILPADGRPLVISGKFDRPGDLPMYSFSITELGKLHGEVKAGDIDANLRINQLIAPGGEANGPFGQDLNVSLRQKGIYKIVIAPNLMAENAYAGPFKLTLRLNK